MAMMKSTVKKRNAWLSAILALAMVLGMAGCSGRQPTAKSLMAGIPGIDPQKYYDMTVEMDITAQAEHPSSDVSLSFGAEGRDGLMHLYDMDMTLGVSGISIAFSMEAWMEQDSDAVYATMTMFGEDSGWMLLSMDSDALPVAPLQEMIGSMSSLARSDAELTLNPHEAGEDLVVTWVESDVEVDGLAGAFGGLLDGFAGSQTAGTGALSTGDIRVQAHFDEETYDLKFIRIETDANGSDSDAAIYITISFNTFNSDLDLSIPQDVIDAAVDVSGLL